MNNDVRQLFTYSITIEGESMTLWSWSRSHSVKTKPFDFTAGIPTTVCAFASFIFATTDELGYHTSVQRRLDLTHANSRLCLVFRIQGRYFKTLRTVVEHRGTNITARTTRIFEAVEVKSFDDLTQLEKKTKILKDVWIDDDARTERQIQDAILQDLDTLSDKLISDGSLNSEHFHDVSEEEKKLVCDALRDRRYRNHFLTIDCDEQGAQCKGITSDTAPAPDTPGSPRSFVPKRRYRVVYSEVCQALHDIVDLRTVLQAMLDCLLVVQLLFLIGWVHRDISSGNLLWYSTTEGGRGILSDLEYAKKFNPDGRGNSDPKTGTPYFMAIEMQYQTYFKVHHLNRKLSIQDESIDETLDAVDKKMSHVIHNYEHDLESFFWLLLWTIIARIDSEALQAFARPIFDYGAGYSASQWKISTTMGAASQRQLAESCLAVSASVHDTCASLPIICISLTWTGETTLVVSRHIPPYTVQRTKSSMLA
ncbi:hypothetical protein DENSPDRAFT_617523 [Dentipellis sp. KUC8613]|nr:hypothetical protein DENSPDRAFT_617523 [Dentipellis sp. KUC8613]